MEFKRPTKRKGPAFGLQRRVRARRDEPDPEDVPEDIPSEDSEEDEVDEDMSGEPESASEADANSEEDSDQDDEGYDGPGFNAAKLSFGALAKAQASLPSTRKKQGQQDDEDDDDSPPEESSAKPSFTKTKFERSSKHAPTEVSSRRPVTRKREVVAVTTRKTRDPRFESLTGPVDEERARKAYSFLDDYRESEMAQLREAIKKAKTPEAKEELKKTLVSMQSRKKTQQRKDKEKEIIQQHRRKEKELVAQGKQPFYLKRSEQKKRLLMDQFAGMKGKQVDRAIERRRKKTTAKERRDMPFTRREVGRQE